MEAKFLPNLFRRRARDNSPVAHAISGSAAATSGMWGSVFSTAAGGWDVQRAVNEGLERVLWVFRCCDAIASNQTGKLTVVVREEDPVNGRIVKDPRIHKLLNRRPNIHETAQDFRYRLSIQLLLSKRGAFIEIVRDQFGRPKALELLPPHLVEPIPDAETFVAGYRLLNQVTLEEVILPKERVIWVKLKPHPIDPYLQMTPLSAAGLIVDTEWLSRLFNRNFLLNDGRPGLLIAIRGHMNQIDQEEIKRRFNGGPQNAGRVTVVEGEDLNATDLSATPRDLQYLEALRGAKEDILLAFGVPESVLGNASGRTYDNADAEKETFWEETMVPHCNTLARGLDPLTGSIEDDRFVSFDYDSVEVLQRRKKERHAKLKEELDAGHITLDEYFEGTGRKPWNVAGTRVLYHSSGMIIAKTPEDAQEASQQPMVGMPSYPEVGGPPTPEIQSQFSYEGAMKGQRSFGNEISARTQQLQQAASEMKALPRFPYSTDHRVYGETEDGEVVEGDLLPPVEPVYEPDHSGYEEELAQALKSWDDLQTQVIPERLMHVKVRKFTRHWEGDGSGTKALDPQYVVELNRWANDILSSLTPLMRRVATESAREAAREMVRTGVASVMHARGQGNPRSRSALGKVFGSTDLANQAVSGLLRPLEQVVTDAAKRHSARVMERIADMDADGASITQIQNAIRQEIGTRSQWRQRLATYLTTSLTEGGKDIAYDTAGDLTTKTWNTREDEKVRRTHRKLNGRSVTQGRKFRVGKYWMSRPGDPRGGIEETINCRCWLSRDINPAMGRVYDEYAG